MLKKLLSAAAILPAAVVLGGGAATPASAQTIFNTQAAFDAATNTEKIDVPNIDYWSGDQCAGLANTGGDLTGAASVVMPFDAGNNLTVTQIYPGSGAIGLCIFADAFVPALTNTDPNQWGTENLLVGNGEDDYQLVFTNPVTAFAFKILTNSPGTATVTLKDGGGAVIGTKTVSAAGDFAVAANEISEPDATFDNDFIGFASTTPIKTVEIDTTGGASQNSGLLAFWAGALIDTHINVHPASDPNPLNLSSGGTTPVAIFGSDTLDVATIDIGQLTLADAAVKTVGKSDRALCKIADIGSYDESFFDNYDPTPDGFDDLVCHFVTADLSGVLNGSSTSVDLHITGCTDPAVSGDPDVCEPGDDGYYMLTESDAVKVVKE